MTNRALPSSVSGKVPFPGERSENTGLHLHYEGGRIPADVYWFTKYTEHVGEEHTSRGTYISGTALVFSFELSDTLYNPPGFIVLDSRSDFYEEEYIDKSLMKKWSLLNRHSERIRDKYGKTFTKMSNSHGHNYRFISKNSYDTPE